MQTSFPKEIGLSDGTLTASQRKWGRADVGGGLVVLHKGEDFGLYQEDQSRAVARWS